MYGAPGWMAQEAARGVPRVRYGGLTDIGIKLVGCGGERGGCTHGKALVRG